MESCFRDRRCRLQHWAKVGSIVDIILAVTGITTSAADLEMLIRLQGDLSKTDIEKDYAMKSVYMIYVATAVNIIKLIMGYTLWIGRGRKERGYTKTRSWLMVTIVLWIIQFASFLVKLSIGAFVVTSTISTSLALLGRIFAMKVVSIFVNEMAIERTGGSGGLDLIEV